MTEQEIREFRAWCLIDTVGIGIGLKEYIEEELDTLKKALAIEILNLLD